MRWLPIHDIAKCIGPDKTHGLLFFHAFSGCDIVSAFRGKGKKSAWQTWNIFPEVTPVFQKLNTYPVVLEEKDFDAIQKFVVMLYDKNSREENVDDCRLDLFARKQRAFDSIPPTKAALLEHCKRAIYQAACVWGQSTKREMEYERPEDWGWIRDDTDANQFKVFWSSLPPIAKCCSQLTRCGCKKDCKSRCKCNKLELKCTQLCSCGCDI